MISIPIILLPYIVKSLGYVYFAQTIFTEDY